MNDEWNMSETFLRLSRSSMIESTPFYIHLPVTYGPIFLNILYYYVHDYLEFS